MTYENYIKGMLATFAVEEAYRYGGSDCPLAVAQVIANRVKAGWHGGDWRKVLLDAPKTRGTIYSQPFEYDTRESAFRQILTLIDDVYYGIADSSNVNVEGEEGTIPALYYCVLHNANNVWFKANILNDQKSHPRIAVVGQLTFFG
jgi:hypothetical protein